MALFYKKVICFEHFRVQVVLIVLILVFHISICEYIPPGPRYKCPVRSQIIHPCICLQGTDKGLFLRCEKSNLASLSVAFLNIASLQAPVENLTIYKSNIERLYGTILYKAKVRILHIEETPIKSIDEHTFYGINNTLEELHIRNSRLLEFPAAAFKVLGNLTVLNIDGHRIQKLEKNILADSLLPNRLEKLHLTNGPLDDLPVESFQLLRKLKTLDLHSNALSSLKRNQFKNLRDVEVLDLSYNKIPKLESQHIADLTKLSWCNVSHNALTELSRRLYLNDNLISDVGRGTFGSITRIGTIDLARNALKKIDFQMFSQLNYVEIIDVAENNITEIQKQSFKDLYLTKINISYNSVEKIENNSFENCANITLLDLSHNLLKEIPRDAFDSTTYATELQLSYNLFTEITQIPIHNMTGLKIFNISHNSVVNIPKNTFPKLYELHTIDASYNNVSVISNAVFQTLFSLRNLNLSYNQMSEIKTAVFGTLPTLLDLNISHNKLKSIARGGLTKLTSLRFLDLKNNMLEQLFEIPISLNYLDFRNNWLQEIPDGTWPRMNSLLMLDLSGNRLANNLHGGSFSGLLTLQTLTLNENGISIVPFESLTDLPTLQYLHMENNNITELSKSAFGKLPVVFELNLYNNNINNISVRAFDGLLQLLTLNLSSNGLKYIPNEAFVGLVSLRKLDLSYNSLEKLDNKTHGLLDDCLSLEMVNISHNKISFLTRKSFPSNPYIPYKLREIDLSHNLMPVLTYDLTFGTKKVKKLILSNNFINDVRRGVIGNLTSLEVLDLSSNSLTDLSTEKNIFTLPTNLTEIYLQDNQLTKIPFEEFLKAENVVKIDLRGNQLETFPLPLAEKVKNGTKVFYKGNPLKCDCETRPIKHYLESLTDLPEEFVGVECFSPQYVTGKSLAEVSDDQLYCVSSVESPISSNEIYDVLPDLRFRDVLYLQGKLTLRWFVTSTRDIADFYVNIRDKKNTIYFDKHLSYDSRKIEILGEFIRKALEGSDLVQVCVLAKDSNGVIGRWFESQCITMPENFESVLGKYIPGYNYVYSLLIANPEKDKIQLARSGGVIGNLTSLEVLDLSSNSLTDLSTEKNIFTLPTNLTEIYLQDNQLTKIPFEEFLKAENVVKIDLRGNQLETFPLPLAEKVKNGTKVFYKGNPLKCDCETRPIKHYLESLTDLPEEFVGVECFSPQYVTGKSLAEVSDDQLYCVSSVESPISSNEIYDVLPDLRFRDVLYLQGKLTLRWFVTSTRDIADFYVNIRDKKNTIYFDKHLSYDSRKIEILGEFIRKALEGSDLVQVCVLAKDSNGVIGRWFESQCITMPENFESVLGKYIPGYNYVYSLLIANPEKDKIQLARSGGKSLISNNYLLILTSIWLIIELLFMQCFS